MKTPKFESCLIFQMPDLFSVTYLNFGLMFMFNLEVTLIQTVVMHLVSTSTVQVYVVSKDEF